jgi:WD40 repeat protein
LSKLPKKLIPVLWTLLCLAFFTKAQINNQSADALIAKLGCPDRVKDVAFSPDGKLLAAGYGWNDQGGITIWNVADRTTVATLVVGKGDSANIERVAFSPDGKLFAAADWDGDVLLWTIGDWRSHKTVIAHRGSPKSLTFSPTGAKLAFASEEAAILYDLRSGKVITVDARKTERDSFIGISFSPDERTVTVFRDNVVEVRDVESGKQIRSWKPTGGGFFGRSSPDGQYVIAGGGAVYGRKSVEVWNAPDGKKVGEVSDFRGGLFALAISNSGKHFAVAGGNYGSGGDLSLWDLQEAREIGYVSFGEMPIEGLAFSPDDKVLAAGSNDGFVLLYAVDRIKGTEVKKQTTTLCGEVEVEGNKVFIVPLSKVPGPMTREFEYAWKLEVTNSNTLTGLVGSPVVFQDWAIESNAATDRARVSEFKPLLSRGNIPGAISNYILFGDIQNPGWNEGSIIKVYGDSSFVAANNAGKCLAYGHLDQLSTSFETLKKRLVGEGLLSVPKEPLTLGTDHYRTRFIGLASDGAPELRSDADSIEVLLKGGPAKKREAFSRVFNQEEQIINSLLRAGLKLPQK